MENSEENKTRDRWDKADIILKPSCAIFTALAVAALGFFGSNYLKNRDAAETALRERTQAAEMSVRERTQATEMNVRLYTELMSKREEAESALRKDMFQSIIQSFLKAEKARLKPKEKVLNLELLAYNFHESLNLKPLFVDLEKEITASGDNGSAKRGYLDRLNKVASDVNRKEMLVLEQAGQKFERRIDLNQVPIDSSKAAPLILVDETLYVDGIERNFKISVQQADRKTKELQIKLDIKTPRDSGAPADTNSAEFWVGFFDFPLVDNTRLSQDQRCAIVVNRFVESSVDITLVYFPGSYASLKDKPYYQEVVQKLVKTKGL